MDAALAAVDLAFSQLTTARLADAARTRIGHLGRANVLAGQMKRSNFISFHVDNHVGSMLKLK